MHDTLDVSGWKGHVVMESDRQGIIHDGPNLVLNQAIELMVRALIGSEAIGGVVFANSGGRPVSPGFKTIPGAVNFSNAVSPEIGVDRLGKRTVATWRATWTPSDPQVYDMIGLVTTARLPFAALSFNQVELAAGETVAVNWTLLLRS